MSETTGKGEIELKVGVVESGSEVSDVTNRAAEVDDVKNESTIRNVKNDAEGTDDIGCIVTDSVHERFRQPYVYCPQCKINIPASKSEIENHFNQSHYSDNCCLYCNAKVFQYLSFGVDVDGNEYTKHVTHHRCNARE